MENLTKRALLAAVIKSRRANAIHFTQHSRPKCTFLDRRLWTLLVRVRKLLRCTKYSQALPFILLTMLFYTVGSGAYIDVALIQLQADFFLLVHFPMSTVSKIIQILINPSALFGWAIIVLQFFFYGLYFFIIPKLFESQDRGHSRWLFF